MTRATITPHSRNQDGLKIGYFNPKLNAHFFLKFAVTILYIYYIINFYKNQIKD